MRKRKLLVIVEDNKDESFILEEAIKEAKLYYDLIFFQDGQQVIDYFTKSNEKNKPNLPDLILLDLNLPKRHGFEVLEELKNDRSEYKFIPLIVMSSSEAPNDIEKCYSLHCNAYISKPYDYDSLVDIVKSISSFWLESATLVTDL